MSGISIKASPALAWPHSLPAARTDDILTLSLLDKPFPSPELQSDKFWSQGVVFIISNHQTFIAIHLFTYFQQHQRYPSCLGNSICAFLQANDKVGQILNYQTVRVELS